MKIKIKENMAKLLGIDNLSKDNVNGLTWAFAQIGGAPVPADKQDYWDGTPSWIIPFTKFGFVARISPETDIDVPRPHWKLPLVRDPFLLRPLGSIKAGDFRVDLQPAWEPEVEEEDELRVDKQISDRQENGRNIYIDGEGSHNYLYLPFSKTINFPNGFPVIFDPLKITGPAITEMLHPNVYDLSPQRRRKPDIQDRIYGHLRDAFSAACDPTQPDLIPEKMDNFLFMCRRKSEDPNGILHPDWTTNDDKPNMDDPDAPYYKNMQEIARHYDAKLSGLERIANIMEMKVDIAA
jgi:hypothetical protein